MNAEGSGKPETQKQRDLSWLVVLFFTLIWVGFVHSRAYSTNETSRLASIESLVHQGTWAIDDSHFEHTLDKIRVGEQFYSTKPPTLSFLGAGIYLALNRGLNQTLEWRECVPDRTPSHCLAILELEDTNWPYVILVLLLVSLPATITLVLVYRTGLKHGMPNWANLALVLFLGLGTALFPYSTVFSNHSLSAAGLVVAVYVLFNYREPTGCQLAVAGFAATLSASVDLSTGIYLIALLSLVIVRHRRRALYFFLGGLAPGLLAIGLNLTITSTPLPPQLYTQGYDYPGSAFLTNPGGHRTSQDVAAYTFHLLVGERGWFSFYPIVLWYLYALLKSMASRDDSRRQLAWSIGIATLGYFLYFALRTNSYGGFTFGTRWLLNPVPVLALFAVDPSVYRPSPRLKATIVAILGILSVVSTYRGALNPWGPAYPLVRLSYEIPEKRQFIALAMSGYAEYEAIDPNIRESFGSNTVLRRIFDAQHGFVVPEGDSWWFINESTPLNDELASAFGLEAHGTLALKSNLVDEAEAWLQTFDRTAYQSPTLIPTSADSLDEVETPLSFGQDGDRITLLGYKLNQEADRIALVSAWRLETRSFPTGERKIFAHLLADDGSIVTQDDRFSARYDGLFPGDLFFQSQTLELGDLEPGEYWLQIGLYDPESGERLLAEGLDRLIVGRVAVGISDEED